MRHLRRTVLATLAAALCAAPVAVADNRHENGGGAVVAPARGGGLTGGELLAEDWAQGLVRLAGDDPFNGRCRTLVGNVMVPAYGEDFTATCTVTKRTRLFVFFGSFFTNLEGFETEDEQLAAAVSADQAIQRLTVTLDGDRVNIRRPRFELFSPQRAVDVPEDNAFGLPAGPLTFTAHAWGAVIRKLRHGRHIVTLSVVAPEWGDPFSLTIVLNVVRGGGSGKVDD